MHYYLSVHIADAPNDETGRVALHLEDDLGAAVLRVGLDREQALALMSDLASATLGQLGYEPAAMKLPTVND
jgi:hypothetical protein